MLPKLPEHITAEVATLSILNDRSLSVEVISDEMFCISNAPWCPSDELLPILKKMEDEGLILSSIINGKTVYRRAKHKIQENKE